jgi:hypothetical protein
MAEERNCDKLRVKWKHKTAVCNKSDIRRGTNLRFFLAIKEPRRSEKQRTNERERTKRGRCCCCGRRALLAAGGAQRKRERERGSKWLQRRQRLLLRYKRLANQSWKQFQTEAGDPTKLRDGVSGSSCWFRHSRNTLFLSLSRELGAFWQILRRLRDS